MDSRDSEYLDGIAKTLAGGQGRRQVLRLLCGTVLSTALGVSVRAGAEAAAGICKGSGKKCKRGKDCCSGQCKNNRCRCSNSSGAVARTAIAARAVGRPIAICDVLIRTAARAHHRPADRVLQGRQLLWRSSTIVANALGLRRSLHVTWRALPPR